MLICLHGLVTFISDAKRSNVGLYISMRMVNVANDTKMPYVLKGLGTPQVSLILVHICLGSCQSFSVIVV